MTKVSFYEDVEDSLLKYAVILAQYQGKWILCRHQNRQTVEFPGGHREPGEVIIDTAKRELYEETGAIEFTLTKIGAYSVETETETNFGMFYYADVTKLAELPPLEIAEIFLVSEFSENWTYPDIQPYLLKYYQEYKEKHELFHVKR